MAEQPRRSSGPLASVVLCAYDGERFLREAVDSALAGVYQAVELIAVDDGSTDGTLAVLESVGDPRLRIVHQSNQGASAALAAGIRAAAGEYIAFLDQDDRWRPDFLATLIDRLESRPGLDLVFSWFQVINEEGTPMGLQSHRCYGTIGFQKLLADFVIGASSNVVARAGAVAAAGGPDPILKRYYDLDLFQRIALLRPDNVEAVPRDLMFYRRRGGQISQDWRGMQREYDLVLDKLRRLAPEAVTAAEPLARSNMTRYFARLAYEAGDYREGLRLLREAFRAARSPFLADRRNWTTGAACLSGCMLPEAAHRRLERLAGLRR